MSPRGRQGRIHRVLDRVLIGPGHQGKKLRATSGSPIPSSHDNQVEIEHGAGSYPMTFEENETCTNAILFACQIFKG